jgi:hypothetical protein
MSKQQQSELDAMLRQAPLDDRADVPTLRAATLDQADAALDRAATFVNTKFAATQPTPAA